MVTDMSVPRHRDGGGATNHAGGLELRVRRLTTLLVEFGETSSVSSDFNRRVLLNGSQSPKGGEGSRRKKDIVMVSRGIGDGGERENR